MKYTDATSISIVAQLSDDESEDKDSTEDRRVDSWQINGQDILVGHTYQVSMGGPKTRRAVFVEINDILRSKSGKTAKLFVDLFCQAAEYFEAAHPYEIILLHKVGFSADGNIVRWTHTEIFSKSILSILEEVDIEYPYAILKAGFRRGQAGHPLYVCYWTMSYGREGLNAPAIFRIPPGENRWETLRSALHPEVAGFEVPQIYTRPTTLELYAGCGGTARGFDDASFEALAGVDSNVFAALSWEVRDMDLYSALGIVLI